MFDDDAFENRNKYRETPLFKKATEILKLANRIAEIAANYEPEKNDNHESEILQSQAMMIREDASIIPAKIAGAWGADLYAHKMEKAAIIRKCAKDLSLHMTSLEIYGFKETEYLNLLRDEIEAFRILFAEWVKTFDPWNYIIDEWGLFNPPGINYDDADPDDDLPFDPDDFEDWDGDED
ncbi:MAG: hypothetical protein WBG71_12065 [Leeuwenhoekiella sp.]